MLIVCQDFYSAFRKKLIYYHAFAAGLSLYILRNEENMTLIEQN